MDEVLELQEDLQEDLQDVQHELQDVQPEMTPEELQKMEALRHPFDVKI